MYKFANSEYISDVIGLKKSVNRIIEETMDKSLNICLIRDKSFKKILDSVEASRNLAEFSDWKIKECTNFSYQRHQRKNERLRCK